MTPGCATIAGLVRGVQAAQPPNALVIGIALALPAGGYALLESLRPARRAARARAAHLALSRAAGARADAEALGRRLRADPRISAVRFVPREEALKEMSAVQGLREVIAALGRNPLPDAFVITRMPTSRRSSAGCPAWRTCRRTPSGPGGWPRLPGSWSSPLRCSRRFSAPGSSL